jgi:hypothetical protein
VPGGGDKDESGRLSRNFRSFLAATARRN